MIQEFSSEDAENLQSINDLKDARPKVRFSDETAFEKAENLREVIAQQLIDTLSDMKIDGEVTKSTPYSYDTWVMLRLWLPKNDSPISTWRGSARIDLTANPGKLYPVTVSLAAESAGKAAAVSRIVDFRQQDVQKLIEFVAGTKRKLRKATFRRSGLIFGRNKNVPRPGRFMRIIASIFPLFFIGKRQLDVTSGQPRQNPRQLVRMDSWQTVIIDLGSLAEKVKTEVCDELVTGKHEDAVIDAEKISYLGSYGKSEREQIAVTFRRAITFIEIHRYGNDLYLDWEAYLNLGIWKEVVAGSGYDTNHGLFSTYHEMQRSIELLNEYDLSDANFLIEWIHASIVKVLKRLQKEKKIDQEIDFTIQRVDRKDVLSEGNSVADKKSKKRVKRRA
jgi:hypothetical protein